MRALSFIAGFCLSVLAAGAAMAQSGSLKSALDKFHPTFDQTFTKHGLVGGVYAFQHAGDPATTFFFGEARQGNNQSDHQKIAANTAYNWASITKTFTAIAIMQLRDRGLLSLDDPAVKYVPELAQVHNPYGQIEGITVRMLLSHSAGFRNPTWPWDCDSTPDCSWVPFEPTHWAQVNAMLPFSNIAFKPGSRWSYSNVGYVFLGQIIERLSGDDYEIYVTKNILMPLGMTESYFDRSPYYLRDRVSGSYLRAGGQGALTPQPFDFDSGITVSNSGLKSPVTDMLKYARFLIGDPKQAVYETVLKRSSLDEMWNGTLSTANPNEPATAYTGGPGGVAPAMGLGFFTLNVDGHKYVYHDGDQGGFTAELMIDPERKSASIVMSNTTDTGAPVDATHAQSNTEPDPKADPRIELRNVLVKDVFPAVK